MTDVEIISGKVVNVVYPSLLGDSAVLADIAGVDDGVKPCADPVVTLLVELTETEVDSSEQ